MAIDFTYLMQGPAKYTFEMPKVKRWTESWCSGHTLNLFAGMVRLKVNEVRVDLDENAPADYHCDAYDFVCKWKGPKFDTIVFDPPYNLRKSREKYGARYVGSLTKIKNELPKILNLGGCVISFGYDTVGMSRKRGFEKVAVCVICHSGDHNDTLVVVEKYTQPEMNFV